jgi:hypothetical protein
MTLSEAITVMKIMATADNWCSQCGPSLIEDFGKAFPQFSDIANGFDIAALRVAYNKKQDENIDKDIWETNVWELS